MHSNATRQPVDAVHQGGSEESPEAAPAAEQGSGGPFIPPQVTFRGNTYDLVSLGSLVTGALLLFSCLTCNTGYYCLPLISIALGAVGVLGAQQSVDVRRTRLWSWLGIAAGAIIFLIIVLFLLLYIGFIVLLIATGQMQ